jgi:hypothetical protein
MWSEVMFIELERLRLQVSFGCFQATPPRIAEEPETFLRQFSMGSAQGRFAQRGVKNFLSFGRVAQHQETKTIKLRQILLSVWHA